MMSSLGSPLHVCAVGEGPFSLNHPLSHYHRHLSCSILKVGHQLWPAFVSYPCASKVLLVKRMRILVLVCNGVFRICIKIRCHLGKDSYGMTVCGVVCHGNGGRNLSFCGMRNFIRKVCGMTWSNSYGSRDGCCSYTCCYVSRIGNDWTWIYPCSGENVWCGYNV